MPIVPILPAMEYRGPAYELVDDGALIAAIGEVESGNNPQAIGRGGELSEYQFTRDTWRWVMGAVDFREAYANPGLARVAALRLVARLRYDLMIEDRAPTVENLARGWNPGGGAEYAARVGNIYEEYLAQRRRDAK